jgi:PAS domain S-box-containing protein
MLKATTLLLAACCSFVWLNPARAKPIKNILVLHEGWDKMPTNALFNEQLQEAFSRDGSFDVQLFQEYMDARLGQGLAETADFLHRKYAKQKFDLIVAGGFRAFNFLLSEGESTFPGVPGVFLSYADFEKVKDRLPKNITGVTAQLDIAGTVNLALRLQPETRNLFVVYGSSQYERAEMPRVLAQLPSIAGHLNVSYLSDMTLEETLTRVSSLPDHSVILFFTFLSDASGHVYVPTQVCTLVSTYANAPVYSFPQVDLGRGTVGGSIFNIEKSTQEVAQMAVRILKGADVQDVPVRRGPPNEVTLDWRQLQRWHIPESRLPKGAVVLFREPGSWERYRWYILGALAIVLLQSALITALVAQARRRAEATALRLRAEEAAQESEGRFTVVTDSAPMMVWMSGVDKLCTYFNKGWLDFTGRSLDQELGDGWSTGVHPDDLARSMNGYSQAFDDRRQFKLEYRLRRHDGEYRWIMDSGVPRYAPDGTFCGYVGSCIDITELKHTEQELEELSGRLIYAQEEERKRVARELHDDLGQQLTVLAMELADHLNAPQMPTHVSDWLHHVSDKLQEVSRAMNITAHQLHSAHLEVLGPVSALQGLCDEFSRQHGIKTSFVHSALPTRIPPDVSLCLYRVAQEGLQNVAKHSGALSCEVKLTGDSNGIRLFIKDTGVGFDTARLKLKPGLGFVSMRERLRLVGGAVAVESTPSQGTRLDVHVPLSSELGRAVGQ